MRIKRIFSFFTAAFLLLSMQTTLPVSAAETTENEAQFLYGDVTLDGVVSLPDTILLNKVITGSITPNETQLKCGDCDSDGTLTTNDSIALLRFLVQLEPSLPVTIQEDKNDPYANYAVETAIVRQAAYDADWNKYTLMVQSTDNGAFYSMEDVPAPTDDVAYSVGDTIRVYYDNIDTDTYPPQLTERKKIELLHDNTMVQEQMVVTSTAYGTINVIYADIEQSSFADSYSFPESLCSDTLKTGDIIDITYSGRGLTNVGSRTLKMENVTAASLSPNETGVLSYVTIQESICDTVQKTCSLIVKDNQNDSVVTMSLPYGKTPFCAGDVMEIYHNGSVQETYPGKYDKIWAVRNYENHEKAEIQLSAQEFSAEYVIAEYAAGQALSDLPSMYKRQFCIPKELCGSITKHTVFTVSYAGWITSAADGVYYQLAGITGIKNESSGDAQCIVDGSITDLIYYTDLGTCDITIKCSGENSYNYYNLTNLPAEEPYSIGDSVRVICDTISATTLSGIHDFQVTNDISGRTVKLLVTNITEDGYVVRRVSSYADTAENCCTVSTSSDEFLLPAESDSINITIGTVLDISFSGRVLKSDASAYYQLENISSVVPDEKASSAYTMDALILQSIRNENTNTYSLFLQDINSGLKINHTVTNADTVLRKGDTVRIVHSGVFIETAPERFGQVYWLEKISSGDSTDKIRMIVSSIGENYIIAKSATSSYLNTTFRIPAALCDDTMRVGASIDVTYSGLLVSLSDGSGIEPNDIIEVTNANIALRMFTTIQEVIYTPDGSKCTLLLQQNDGGNFFQIELPITGTLYEKGDGLTVTFSGEIIEGTPCMFEEILSVSPSHGQLHTDSDYIVTEVSGENVLLQYENQKLNALLHATICIPAEMCPADVSAGDNIVLSYNNRMTEDADTGYLIPGDLRYVRCNGKEPVLTAVTAVITESVCEPSQGASYFVVDGDQRIYTTELDYIYSVGDTVKIYFDGTYDENGFSQFRNLKRMEILNDVDTATVQMTVKAVDENTVTAVLDDKYASNFNFYSGESQIPAVLCPDGIAEGDKLTVTYSGRAFMNEKNYIDLEDIEKIS